MPELKQKRGIPVASGRLYGGSRLVATQRLPARTSPLVPITTAGYL